MPAITKSRKAEQDPRSKDPNLKYSAFSNDFIATRTGVYLAKGVWDSQEEREIEVYTHPVKGLCCFSEDFGSGGTGEDDRYDCHVSVAFTGLDFIRRLRNLNQRPKSKR